MTVATLNGWVPNAAVRTRHHRSAAAEPDALWDAARAIRLSDTRRLGRMVRWRIPGLDGALRYHDMFRAYPFVVLEESERELVSGLCGRIWTAGRDYPRLADASAFETWREPGTVRVAFAHSVRATERGAEIVSEARVHAIDTHARLRLRAIWAVLGPFEPLVAAEPLSLAVRRAESK